MTPRLFVVSGPSGVGKGTLVERLRERRPDLGLTVSATTRDPRPGEVPDVSYHFLSNEEFDRLVDEGAFVEWAQYGSNRYGTLRSEVQKNLEVGHSVVLEIDVRGGLNVKRLFPDDAVLVFIEPPSREELEHRLRHRGTEDEERIQVRLAQVAREYEAAKAYDAAIVNDDLERATAELVELVQAEESK